MLGRRSDNQSGGAPNTGAMNTAPTPSTSTDDDDLPF